MGQDISSTTTTTATAAFPGFNAAGTAYAELLANASIEIAPRAAVDIAAVAQALPVNACVYVSAPAARPLSETLAAVAAIRQAGLTRCRTLPRGGLPAAASCAVSWPKRSSGMAPTACC